MTGPSLPLVVGLALAVLGGCGTWGVDRPPAELGLVSRDPGPGSGSVASAAFGQVLYRYESDSNLTILLFDGPADDPTRVAVLSMFWRPRAGSTPVDRTATNVVVRYLNFDPAAGDDDALGVYAGAGFMRVYSDPAAGALDGTLFDADLRLIDRSETFTDRLGRTALAGSFEARRDDARVTTILRRLNLRVSEALGYPRLVLHPRHHDPA